MGLQLGSFRRRGIVLPVVLIMLVLMTTVVLFLVRRGTVDERLAANVRGLTTLETAAQYGVRWCEAWIWRLPPGVQPPAGVTELPPRVMAAPASNQTAAWRVDANWTNESVDLSGAAAGLPDVTSVRCLIEDARGELEVLPVSPTGNPLADPDSWRKYRVTVEVQGVGGRVARAQSEFRMNVIVAP